MKRLRDKDEEPGRSGRLTTPPTVQEILMKARIRAQKISARARANKRAATKIARAATELENELERCVVLIDGGFSMTLKKPVSREGRPPRRRRRERKHSTLTRVVCDDLRVFGRKGKKS